MCKMAEAPRERDRGSSNVTHAMETLEMKKRIAMALLNEMDEEEDEEEEEKEAESLQFQSWVLLMKELELEQSLLVLGGGGRGKFPPSEQME